MYDFLKNSLTILLAAALTSGTALAEIAPTFVGSATCANCHQQETADWKGSFHERAMAEASPATVLGNFGDATFTYNGIVSKFYRRGDEYFVRTDGPDGKLQEYKIDYTFGVFPLQQYLVKFPDGKMQALSISWDARAAKDGGQRWFHLYENERVDYKDVLHWTKLGQNWNSMCAECHSTNLQKNYDPEKKAFHTTWSEISVGCEACHGPGSQHLTWAGKKEAERSATERGFLFSLKNPPFTAKHDPESGKTLPSVPLARTVELDTCGRCHSRRAVIAKDYSYGQPLMATHFPSLLTEGLYHADGQILDEVYEYGSFVQSKMAASGVTCSDCHNPHSLKLRLPGNGVCSQCHQAAKYDTPKHHFHKVDSPGAACKSCHMAQKKYMTIDPRSDHSMRIPAPAMAAKVGAPNACNTCHLNKSSDWAEKEIRTRFGAAKPNFHDFGTTLSEARAGDQSVAPRLLELASDDARPAIVRATAISEMARYLSRDTLGAVASQLYDESPLVRAAALDALSEIPADLKVQMVAPLLNDAIRGVRIEAARVLASVPSNQLSPETQRLLEPAIAEYIESQRFNAESPQAQINLGIFYAQRGMLAEAQKSYQTAIELEPQFVPAYVNLADLYRETGRDQEGLRTLQEATQRVPRSAEARYALALLFVRIGEKEKAIAELKRATELQPTSVQFVYVYIIALRDIGKEAEAKRILVAAKKRFPNSPELTSLETPK